MYGEIHTNYKQPQAQHVLTLPGGSFTGPLIGGHVEMILISMPTSVGGGSTNYWQSSFQIPTNAPTGRSWSFKVTYENANTEYTASTMYYYLGAYKPGDSYTGWNKVSNASFGSFTSAVQYVRYQFTKSVGTIFEPGDIVTLRMHRTNTPANTIYILGIELYCVD
jgi:hypothetical protein